MNGELISSQLHTFHPWISSKLHTFQPPLPGSQCSLKEKECPWVQLWGCPAKIGKITPGMSPPAQCANAPNVPISTQCTNVTAPTQCLWNRHQLAQRHQLVDSIQLLHQRCKLNRQWKNKYYKVTTITSMSHITRFYNFEHTPTHLGPAPPTHPSPVFARSVLECPVGLTGWWRSASAIFPALQIAPKNSLVLKLHPNIPKYFLFFQ